MGDRAPIPRIHFISSILVLPIKTLNLLSRARTPTLLNFAAFCVGFCRDWPFVPLLQKTGKFSDANGRESAINKALDGSTFLVKS